MYICIYVHIYLLSRKNNGNILFYMYFNIFKNIFKFKTLLRVLTLTNPLTFRCNKISVYGKKINSNNLKICQHICVARSTVRCAFSQFAHAPHTLLCTYALNA